MHIVLGKLPRGFQRSSGTVETTWHRICSYQYTGRRTIGGAKANEEQRVRGEGIMSRKYLGSLVVVLAVIVALSTSALAARQAAQESPKQTITGTIATLDASKGAFTLTKEDGQSMHLKAKKKLLAKVHTGDHVKVEMVGKKVKAIEKTTEGKVKALEKILEEKKSGMQ
jgi:hypothetical protein